MADITLSSPASSPYGSGELQLQNKVQMTATLTPVTDNLNVASPLLLSTSLVQTLSTLKITTADNPYIDAEDNSGNNRFTIGRDPASQQVNLDFASNPTGSTTNVGAIRTYKDGTNLSEAMNFREDGNIGVGDLAVVSPSCQLDVIRYTTATDNNYQFRVLNSSNSSGPFATINLEHNNRSGVGDQGGSSIDIVDGFASANRARIQFNYNNTGSFSASGGNLRVANLGEGNLLLATNGVDALRVFKDQGVQIGGVTTNLSSVARLHVVGSGSTSATTSLLVQNSAGTAAFQVKDNQQVQINLGSTLSDVTTPNLTFSSSQTGIYSPNPNQLGIVCYANETARFIYGNALHNGALNIGKFANPNNDAFFGWCSDGSLEITGNAQSVFINPTNNSSVVIGASTAQASAILQADSITKGFLPPRMTTAQKNAIATPAAGLMIYDTDLNKLCVYTTAWETITSV